MSTFVIACGGTGGHLAPGIAVAEVLADHGHDCHLFISSKSVDLKFAQKYSHLNFVIVPGKAFSFSPFGFVRSFYHLIKSIVFSFKTLRALKPQFIVGFGGFSTVGVALAGFLLGIPSILHEANRRTGKAIRLLSVFALRVYLPEGAHLKSLPPKAVRHYGFPVRPEIRRMSRQLARLKLGIRVEGKLLLVFGGSQGASVLNEWVVQHMEEIAKAGVNIYCITGPNKLGREVKEFKLENGTIIKVYFVPFIDNMALVLSAADLAVTRSGAGTIAELTRCRLPSVLIPFPFAADDHQHANAEFLERQGGCIVVSQRDEDRLKDEVLELIFNDWMLNQLRANLTRLDSVDALQLIVDDIEDLCKEGRVVPKSVIEKIDI